MWLDRFKPFLFDLLSNADHPDIDRVDTWESDGHTNIVIHLKDGRSIYLWTVQSSPPGGVDRTKPEVIVKTGDLSETQLAARREGR